jgi:ribosome recycling factor
MSADAILKDAKDRMKKAVAATQNDMANLRSGRVTPSILDRIMVDYYGTPTPVRQMANVSISEGTTIVIQPYDKSGLSDIEKAIAKSDLDIAPNSDGEVIRLNFPPLSTERRKEIAKMVGKIGEEGKVAIRNVRRDAMNDVKKLDKEDGISEDDVRGYEDDVQKLTDRTIKDLEALVTAKEAEVMEV